MNDFLKISNVKVDNDVEIYITKIILTTSTYFSPEEYSIGDTIIIRNASVIGGGNPELEAFLNRDKGHSIIHIAGLSDSSIEMYNQIHIPLDFKVNVTDGSLTSNTFGLNITSPKDMSSNSSILSLNNQNTIFFKIGLLNRKANFTSELI